MPGFARPGMSRSTTKPSVGRLFGSLASVDAFSAFHERFVDSQGGPGFGRVATGPQVRTLPQADLPEYLNVVATLIKKTDSLIIRNRVFEAECRVVLNGVRNEEELTRAVAEQFSLPGSSRYQ
jgi:hypothetical protein